MACDKALRMLLNHRLRGWKATRKYGAPVMCQKWIDGEQAALITSGRHLKQGDCETALYALENAALYRGKLDSCRDQTAKRRR